MSILMVAFYHHPQQAAESVGGYGGGWLEKVAEDSERRGSTDSKLSRRHVMTYAWNQTKKSIKVCVVGGYGHLLERYRKHEIW